MKKAVYYIMIAKVFFGKHPRKGEPTEFIEKIRNGKKIHTIRLNYDLWKKRIDNVNAGMAVIQLRQWTGSAYHSKQITLMEFGKGEIGIQKLQLDPVMGWFIDDVDSDLLLSDLCINDGLDMKDFRDWFKQQEEKLNAMAIIHFTDFRYKNSETA